MLPVISGRRVLILAIAALAIVAWASPGQAQSTGMVKGKVVDSQNKPVENAKVTIEFKEGITRKHEVTTNKKGEFIQIGLPPGGYKVTAEKEKLGMQSFDVRVRLGEAAEVNFVLAPGLTQQTKEEAAKTEKVKGVFEEGVAASRSGNHDLALQKFEEAATLLPGCYDCYYNIGYAYSQKKEYGKAEEAFKKALELKADYIEAYNGLATVYNAEKKFDEAQAASAKAAELATSAAGAGGATGTAGVDALYNQGVIAWNAGKIDEAQAKFEEALKVNPDHADSHYQLGMALLNKGKLQEAVAQFEAYLKLAPDGQYAATAKSMVTQLKK
jgi:Flp pilus assembly protein TadD